MVIFYFIACIGCLEIRVSCFGIRCLYSVILVSFLYGVILALVYCISGFVLRL